MLEHLGLKVRKKEGGLYLTRENYATITNKSSFGHLKGYKKYYEDQEVSELLTGAYKNFDLNMAYFQELSKEEFKQQILTFLEKNEDYQEYTDLSLLKDEDGQYILVLDEYSQVYYGNGGVLSIRRHWNKRTPLDRLVSGSVYERFDNQNPVDESILSINAFRALDTTRVLVKKSDSKRSRIKRDYEIDDKFSLNRSSLFVSISEAIEKLKKDNY